MKSARTVAVMLALAVIIIRADQMKFDAPRANGYRVDACRAWGQGCGKEAADAFCRLNSFESAAAFEIDPHIGTKTPTMTIEDRKVCNQPQCDGFKSITCTRAAPAPDKRRVNPAVIDAIAKAGASKTPPTTPAPSPAPAPAASPAPAPAASPAPAPRDPRNRIPAARLDPAEFVIIKPKTKTVTLGLFGARATTGELEDLRKVPFPLIPDLIQTGVADVDGDGQSELLLLETENPQRPDESALRIFKLDGELEFIAIANTGVSVGKGFPLLTSGRLLAGKVEQALVYTPGEEAVVIGWRLAPPTEIPVHYIKIRGWQPKGVLMVLDANGDGQDDILDYSEAGSLDLVTLGPVELGTAGEGSTTAVSRPLLTLGPAHEFGIGDFTGDGRTDLLIRSKPTRAVSIAQFDSSGMIRSRTTVATDWPVKSSWTRGFDYDNDGIDDLLVYDTKAGSVMLMRFTNQGTLRDTKVIAANGVDSENLRFAGYFMANGRASYLSHVRTDHKIAHRWLEAVDPDVVMGPLKVLVDKVPEGAFVVVGNFRKDR
jgi:FG-GAP-like repeat